jgi:hypothetical protein
MPLTEEQRSLLELLGAGEHYESIAALLGLNGDEVSVRAHRALEELCGRNPDELIEGLADYLLGQADGSTTAKVEAALAADPDVRAIAQTWATEFNELGAPGLRETPAPRRTSAPLQEEPPPGRGRRNVIWLGALIGGAVLLLTVALSTGILGDESEPPPGTDTSSEEVVLIDLNPVAGGQARGTARLVNVSDLPALDVDISGLVPSRPGEVYILWVLSSNEQGIPIAFRDIGPDGRFRGRTQIPAAAIGLLPSADFLDLSLARDRDASAAIRSATEAGRLPRHVGRTVVRGALHE